MFNAIEEHQLGAKNSRVSHYSYTLKEKKEMYSVIRHATQSYT